MKFHKLKLVLILLFSSIIYYANSQNDTINRVDKFGKKYGYWKKMHANGKIAWEGRFYNGEPIGDMYKYYANGQMESHLKYYRNSPKVDVKTYHTNGKKSSEGVFINKEKDGKWLYYNNKGVLISEENWKIGKLNGKSLTYSSESGLLLEESNWANGKLNGEFKTYYTNGKLRTSLFYKNSIIDGEFTSFYISGQVWVKGQYINGLREGTWTTLDTNANELKIVDFEKENAVKMILGFQTSGQWIKLNAESIAYFYYDADRLIIQLNNKKSIPIVGTSLIDIANLAGIEWFVFVTDQILSSYNAIRKVEDISEDGVEEAKITLYPPFKYEVFATGENYMNIKSLLNTEAPSDNDK